MPLCFFSLSPVPGHAPSKAGFISVSTQHLAHQSTNTDTSIPSKSLFKVTQPQGCWLAEAGRDEGSSTAEQLMLSQGHQHSAPPLQHAQENGPVDVFIWDLILHNLKTADLVAPAIGELSSDPFEAELCIFPASFCQGRITNQWKERALVNRRGKKKLVLKVHITTCQHFWCYGLMFSVNTSLLQLCFQS